MIDWDPGFWWGNSSWGDKDGAAYEIQVSRDPYRCSTAERTHETRSWRFTAEHNTERGRAFRPRLGIVLQHTNTDVARSLVTEIGASAFLCREDRGRNEMLAAGDDDLAGVQRREPKVRRTLSVSSGAYGVKHGSHLNSELDLCFSKCSYHLCCVLVMDIVYIWKQKNTNNLKISEKQKNSQFTYYLRIHLQNTVSHTKKNEI